MVSIMSNLWQSDAWAFVSLQYMRARKKWRKLVRRAVPLLSSAHVLADWAMRSSLVGIRELCVSTRELCLRACRRQGDDNESTCSGSDSDELCSSSSSNADHSSDLVEDMHRQSSGDFEQ